MKDYYFENSSTATDYLLQINSSKKILQGNFKVSKSVYIA